MKRSIFKSVLIVVLVISIQACVLGPRSSSSVSLSSVLKPVKDSLVLAEKEPLTFPTTVAVLMVPGHSFRMVPTSTLRLAAEELKKELLKNSKYIASVSVISGEDIREKIDLNTIRSLYGADVVAILTYEQDQRRVQNSFFAFLDIAIIPAFLIPSVKVTTSTVVDGKIIHIPSNAIIFRSNGMDDRSIYLSKYSSEDSKPDEESISSFLSATTKLGNNVSNSLSRLDNFDMSKAVSMNRFIEEQSAAEKTQGSSENEWERVDTFKSSGGGATGLLELFLLGCMALAWIYGALSGERNKVARIKERN